MQLTTEQTQATRLFEIANLVSAAALLAGAYALGYPHLLPGGLVGAAAAAINVRLTRGITQRFLESESKDQTAAGTLLGIKIFCVLACVGGVVYLRPDLAAGMALGFTSILPASFVLAASYALRRLE